MLVLYIFWLGLAVTEATEPFPAVISCSFCTAQRPALLLVLWINQH